MSLLNRPPSKPEKSLDKIRQHIDVTNESEPSADPSLKLRRNFISDTDLSFRSYGSSEEVCLKMKGGKIDSELSQLVEDTHQVRKSEEQVERYKFHCSTNNTKQSRFIARNDRSKSHTGEKLERQSKDRTKIKSPETKLEIEDRNKLHKGHNVAIISQQSHRSDFKSVSMGIDEDWDIKWQAKEPTKSDYFDMNNLSHNINPSLLMASKLGNQESVSELRNGDRERSFETDEHWDPAGNIKLSLYAERQSLKSKHSPNLTLTTEKNSQLTENCRNNFVSMDPAQHAAYLTSCVSPDDYIEKSVPKQCVSLKHLIGKPGIDGQLSSEFSGIIRKHPGGHSDKQKDSCPPSQSRSSASKLNIAEIKRKGRMERMKENMSNNDLALFDPYEKSLRTRNEFRRQTGLVYNWNQLFHKCEWDSTYPECPERYTVIMDRIKEYGLYKRCMILEPRKATVDELLFVHESNAIELLETVCQACHTVVDYERFASCYDAIFINPHTYDVALTAAGSCIELVENILKKRIQNGMALVRPPGHHAMRSEYNGYCFFNNAAIAARHAIERHGLERVLIVDLDVHHGQGIQTHFYDTDKVLYFSIHRFEFGTFWPNLVQSDYDHVGIGKGAGYNFNVPLNEIGMTDIDYFTIFDQILLPVAYEYRPELIILSAGYDALLGCPEGEMRVTPSGYAHLTQMLSAVANGRMAVVLEGGYNLITLAEGAALTLRALLDDPVPPLSPLQLPKDSLMESITNCIAAHKKYWKCFKHCLFPDVPDALLQPMNSTNNIPNTFPTSNCYPLGPSEYPEKLYLTLDINEQINYSIGQILRGYDHKVALIFDERLLEHTNRSGSRPMECPDRLSETIILLKRFGLLDRVLLEKGRKLSETSLTKVHTSAYLEELKAVIATGDDTKYTSIFTNDKSFECALIAAGASLHALDLVMSRVSQTVFALVRPPGHHAEPDKAMGFCLFNNISLVATYGLEKYNLQRILIVDFDVHHCNGTFKIFEKDDKVLVMSLHRHDRGNFFPGTGDYELVGDDAGTGYNVNVAWKKSSIGDAEYLTAFHRVIMPIARKFNPEVVLVSAGFDAAYGDPLGQCCVTPEMYGHMVHMLKGLAQGRLMLFLEGGYNITSLSYSVVMCVKALLGDPLVALDNISNPHDSAINSINDTTTVHHQYWPFLLLPEFDLYKNETRAISACSSGYKDRFCPLPPRCNCSHMGTFLKPIPPRGINTRAVCRNCRLDTMNYCCLTCYYVGCSSGQNGHIHHHSINYEHPLVISLEDLSVWCFKCLSYVSDPVLDYVRNLFHIDKFGVDLQVE